jgi:hypothetical protein
MEAFAAVAIITNRTAVTMDEENANTTAREKKILSGGMNWC